MVEDNEFKEDITFEDFGFDEKPRTYEELQAK